MCLAMDKLFQCRHQSWQTLWNDLETCIIYEEFRTTTSLTHVQLTVHGNMSGTCFQTLLRRTGAFRGLVEGLAFQMEFSNTN